MNPGHAAEGARLSRHASAELANHAARAIYRSGLSYSQFAAAFGIRRATLFESELIDRNRAWSLFRGLTPARIDAGVRENGLSHACREAMYELRFQLGRALGVELAGIDWTSKAQLLQAAEFGVELKDRDHLAAALSHLAYSWPHLVEIQEHLSTPERQLVLRAGLRYVSLLTLHGEVGAGDRGAASLLRLALQFRPQDGSAWLDALDARKEAGFAGRHRGGNAALAGYRRFQEAHRLLQDGPDRCDGLRLSVIRGLEKATAQVVLAQSGNRRAAEDGVQRVMALAREAEELAGGKEPFDHSLADWIECQSVLVQTLVGLGRYAEAITYGDHLVESSPVKRYIEEVRRQRPESPLPSVFGLAQVAVKLAEGQYGWVARHARARAGELQGAFFANRLKRFETIAEAAGREDDWAVRTALIGSGAPASRR